LFGNYGTLNYILQAKYKDLKYRVGLPDIRNFIGTLAKQPDGTIGIFVTNVDYTDGAKNEAESSKYKIILCTEKNVVENIKMMKLKLENENLKKNSSVLEEFNIKNIEFSANENQPFTIFGMNFKCGGSIESISIKQLRYKPY
jgi:restriction endonuclease Mrr